MEARLWVPAVVAVLGFAVALGVMYLPRQVAMKVVAAVYRASFNAAQEYGGIGWLRSESGIAYRKMLVRRAYAIAPNPIGPVPWKLFVTEERFCALVEAAFIKMVELAENLAASENTPVASQEPS
jgi:hypothetical protein